MDRGVARLHSYDNRSTDFALEDCFGGFALSVAEGALQNPYNGLAQLCNAGLGKDNPQLPTMQISSRSRPDFNTPRFYSETAGEALGSLLPFTMCKTAVNKGGSALLSKLGREEFMLSMRGSAFGRNSLLAAESFGAGALQSGLLCPSKGDALRKERINNALSGGIAFASFELASSNLSKASFKNSARLFELSETSKLGNFAVNAGINSIAGAISGLAAAESHAILDEGRFANNEQLGKSVVTMAAVGVGFAGLRASTFKTPDAVWRGADGSFHTFRTETGLGNGEWQTIYEKSFPSGEIQNYRFLNDLTKPGANPEVKLHCSRRNGETSAFSISSKYGEGTDGAQLLLAFIATNPAVRNQGIAAKHLKALSETYKQAEPTAKGLLIEIENPLSDTIPDKAQAAQRLKFYNRQGTVTIAENYQLPSTEAGKPTIDGNLLFLPFNGQTPTKQGLKDFVKNLYMHGYELPEHDPFVVEALGKL